MVKASEIQGRALAGLEEEHSQATQRAKLLGAVLRARRELQWQQEIAAETIARFRRNLQKVEANARADGVELPE